MHYKASKRNIIYTTINNNNNKFTNNNRKNNTEYSIDNIRVHTCAAVPAEARCCSSRARSLAATFSALRVSTSL